jgi:hypothetical protein
MAQDDIVGTFDFRSGAQRGARFTLHPARLTYHATGCIESIQLGAVGAVRVAFERDGRKLGWAVVLALLAAVLFLVAGPLTALGSHAAADVLDQLRQGSVATGHAVGGVLESVLQALTRIASLLPVAGALLGAWAIAWLVLGWLGVTTLTITVGPVERAYTVRGRNALLLDFAEAISTTVTQLHR